MKLSELTEWMRRFEESAESIFDKEEPIGSPTDLVMPRRRWFGRKERRAHAKDAFALRQEQS